MIHVLFFFFFSFLFFSPALSLRLSLPLLTLTFCFFDHLYPKTLRSLSVFPRFSASFSRVRATLCARGLCSHPGPPASPVFPPNTLQSIRGGRRTRATLNSVGGRSGGRTSVRSSCRWEEIGLETGIGTGIETGIEARIEIETEAETGIGIEEQRFWSGAMQDNWRMGEGKCEPRGRMAFNSRLVMTRGRNLVGSEWLIVDEGRVRTGRLGGWRDRIRDQGEPEVCIGEASLMRSGVPSRSKIPPPLPSTHSGCFRSFSVRRSPHICTCVAVSSCTRPTQITNTTLLTRFHSPFLRHPLSPLSPLSLLPP